MNITELAALLDGRKYREEITNEEAKQAKEAGLVVVYGGSDDQMYFAGAIAEELGAYNGTTAYLTENGLLENECSDAECPHFARLKKAARTIKAVWDKEGYSWVYETTISHTTFNIYDQGDKYCRGIVFELATLGL